jgi:hypothetical protein
MMPSHERSLRTLSIEPRSASSFFAQHPVVSDGAISYKHAGLVGGRGAREAHPSRPESPLSAR